MTQNENKPAAASNCDAELGAFVRRSAAALADSPKSFLANVQRAIEDQAAADTSAPAPADERATLSEDRIDWIANAHCPGGTAYPVNVKNAIREALREARASSANETGPEGATVTTAEFEGAIDTLRHVIDCLRQNGSYTDEEGEATDFLEPLLDARLVAPAQAAEPVALNKLRAEMFDWLASCTKEHIDGKVEFINRVTDGFAAIYAAPQPPAQADARDEDAYVAKRMAETLASVYATIIGDDQVDESDGLNAIQRCERAAQVLRIEVELYRAQAEATKVLTPDEIDRISRECVENTIGFDHVKFARAIERALLAAHPGQPEPRAEVTDDARDAARYRWLRDVSVPPHNFYLSVPIEFDGVRYTRAEVDAEIDAAIDAARAGDAS